MSENHRSAGDKRSLTSDFHRTIRGAFRVPSELAHREEPQPLVQVANEFVLSAQTDRHMRSARSFFATNKFANLFS